MADIYKKEVRQFLEKVSPRVELDGDRFFDYVLRVFEDKKLASDNSLVETREIQNPAPIWDKDKDAILSAFESEKSEADGARVVVLDSLINQLNLDIVIDVENPIITLTPEQQVQAAIIRAKKAGADIVSQFTVENVLLGITQLGLTVHVLQTCESIMLALSSGSLYAAIELIIEIDPSNLDAVILSESRILAFRNKIETAAGVPHATTWNQAKTW